MRTTQEIEQELKDATYKQMALARELDEAKRLERMLKEGDYAVATCRAPGLVEGNVYLLSDANEGYYFINGDKAASRNGYYQHRFRKATNEEIGKHLIAEAAKEGWAVGAKVKEVVNGNDESTIRKLSVVISDIHERDCSSVVYNHWMATKKPFVVAHYAGCLSQPIQNMVLIKGPKAPYVNGHTMTYTKHESLVKFGCAHITIPQLMGFNSFVGDVAKHADATRDVAGLQLNSGVCLSKQDIKNILEYVSYINNN